jgi:hypothetical protein
VSCGASVDGGGASVVVVVELVVDVVVDTVVEVE